MKMRRTRTPRRSRVQRRRATVVIAAIVVLVGVAVALVTLRNQISTSEAAVATPVASTDPGIGQLPPSRVIASAGPVGINLPVDRAFAAFTLFRPIDQPDGVEMTPDDGWDHTVWPEDRPGPQTAGLDIAAPAGTVVFAPVTGRISGVRDFVIAGRPAGYQLDISPEAASDVVVRVQSITAIPAAREATSVCRRAGISRPQVGTVVTAGVTCLGQVIDIANDLGDVSRPMIATYTSDGGNHVHVEVVRVGQ